MKVNIMKVLMHSFNTHLLEKTNTPIHQGLFFQFDPLTVLCPFVNEIFGKFYAYSFFMCIGNYVLTFLCWPILMTDYVVWFSISTSFL